ncbi:MAG: hypothetical protein LQ351_002963 [Letrouitia transgressa]|nr:MAG: hypothetical protein LQ351_002963 [Letrouitia transgressa]
MTQQNPPSPPLTEVKEFEDGFYKFMERNSASPSRSETYTPDHVLSTASAPATAYSSPEPRHVRIEPYGQSGYLGGLLPMQYDAQRSRYSDMVYPNPVGGYQSLHNYTMSTHNVSSTQSPSASAREKRVTRNNRSLAPHRSVTPNTYSEVESQGSSPPKSKRATKKLKAGKLGEPSLSLPLSQLCPEVPVVDVSEKVNRSAEERQNEARKDGKIKRPNNSFMLYRSAYGDRVKAMYPQNNHQIISTICGASWKMETPEITEKYKAFYEVEKENHAKAHPEYKFSPAKTSPAGRKRKANTDDSFDEEDDFSDPGGYDSEYTPRGVRRSRPAKVERVVYPTSNPIERGVGGHQTGPYDETIGYNRSLYEVTNPGKPLPIPLNSQELYGQYFQTKVLPNGPHVEDVFFHKVPGPSSQQASNHSLVGVPGAHHGDLLANESDDGSALQVDPILLGHDGDLQAQSENLVEYDDFPELGRVASFNDPTHSQDHLHRVQYQPPGDHWLFNTDPGPSDGFANGTDFEAWLDQSHSR